MKQTNLWFTRPWLNEKCSFLEFLKAHLAQNTHLITPTKHMFTCFRSWRNMVGELSKKLRHKGWRRRSRLHHNLLMWWSVSSLFTWQTLPFPSPLKVFFFTSPSFYEAFPPSIRSSAFSLRPNILVMLCEPDKQGTILTYSFMMFFFNDEYAWTHHG